jgi:predicted Zn-dependent protease
MSKPLEPPDIHHLNAAEGWLGLGNTSEAENELAKLPAEVAQHPEVLRVRYHVCEKRGDWERATETARVLCQVAPQLAFGWIHQAYALHELRRTKEAYAVLRPVVDRFPSEYIMRYNLACYSCQLGKLDEARAWLRKSIAVAGAGTIKQLAATDRDLESLWEEIQRM